MVRRCVAIGTVLPTVMSTCDRVIDVISIDALPVKIEIYPAFLIHRRCLVTSTRIYLLFYFLCFSFFARRIERCHGTLVAWLHLH